MKIAFFECFSGISGDMILGSLVDVGLELSWLSNELRTLDLPGVQLSSRRVERCKISGVKLDVNVNPKDDHHHHSHHRNLNDIKAIINNSGLNSGIKNSSISIFEHLAKAEAKVHNAELHDVHFHEVGAVDSIIDIVGAVLGFSKLGIEKILFSSVATGSGCIDCDHGMLPVPAPATAELLKGYTVFSSNVKRELTTPTGAAILTALGKQVSCIPEYRVTDVGYGAGTSDNPEMPNLLRLFVGDSETFGGGNCISLDSDVMWVAESNIDDMSGEMFGYLIDKLLEAGAVDAYMTPIQMKKSRPSVLVSAIVPENRLPYVENQFFEHSTTFGIRKYKVCRSKLLREFVTVQTEFGDIRVKIGRSNNKIENLAPEYEDCKKIANEKGIALKFVYNAAINSAIEKN